MLPAATASDRQKTLALPAADGEDSVAAQRRDQDVISRPRHRNASMGIVAFCPHGHRVKVKDHLAGRKGICPECGTAFRIPRESQAAPPPGSADAAASAAAPVAAPTPAMSPDGLPVARVVSLDGEAAASLPRALPLAAAEPEPGG
jgi:hypothetical protein